MAEQPKQPTIEELQSQMLALQEKQAQQEAQISTLTGENKKLSDDLSKARELNTKLFMRIPVGGQDEPEKETPEEEDSFDNLVDETIKKYIVDKNKPVENK